VAAWVEIEAVETQKLATMHLLEERLSRLLEALLIGVSEVDKVAVVWQYLVWSITILLARLLESVNLSRCEGGCCPLALVLGKEGKSRCPYLVCIAWCILHTTRCTNVCAKVFHNSQ
jgi:hypothetical protein